MDSSASGAAWFYEKGGTRIGPVDKATVQSLVDRGELSGVSLVWPGHGDWIPVSSAGLLFEESSASTPPPIPQDKVDDKIAWAAASVPLIGFFLERVLREPLASLPEVVPAVIYFAAYGVLLALDGRRLKAAGYSAPNMGWIFLVPVYLYQRAKWLKQSQAYTVTWAVGFGIVLALSLGSSSLGRAFIRVQCSGITTEAVQCRFWNEGGGRGTGCTEVVLACNDGRRRSPEVCSGPLEPQAEISRIVDKWTPAITAFTLCSGITIENLKVR